MVGTVFCGGGASTPPSCTANAPIFFCPLFPHSAVVDDQLAKYMALVAQERESKAPAAADNGAEQGEAAYSESFESSREDSFAAGPGFGGVDAARGDSATPTHTPSGTMRRRRPCV